MKTLAFAALFALVAFLAVHMLPPLIPAEAAHTEAGCPSMDFELQAFRDFHKLVEDVRSIRETLQVLVEREKLKATC